MRAVQVVVSGQEGAAGSAAEKIEGVPDEFDAAARRRQLDRHHVKTGRTMLEMPFGEVVEGYHGNLPLLRGTDGLAGITERFGTPALDLNERQNVPLFGDDVDLAEAAPVIAFKDPVSGLFQTGRGQILSPLPCSHSRQRHGRLQEKPRTFQNGRSSLTCFMSISSTRKE